MNYMKIKKKLSQILRKQTHIVKAEIQNIHQEYDIRTNQIIMMQSLKKRIMKNVQTQEKV